MKKENVENAQQKEDEKMNEKISEKTQIEEKNNAKKLMENNATKIDERHSKVALKTAETIKAEGLTEVKIPIDTQNPKDLLVPVIINGYRWEIKRGEKVLVPVAVARILEDAKYI